MYINRICCQVCYGTGKTTGWVMGEQHQDGTGTLVAKEFTCDTCKGKGYNEYPVFTVEEAIKIAEHLGFEIIKED